VTVRLGLFWKAGAGHSSQALKHWSLYQPLMPAQLQHQSPQRRTVHASTFSSPCQSGLPAKEETAKTQEDDAMRSQ
jgi:hypothetical protein